MAGKRAIVILLALGLAALGIYGWISGTATREVLVLIAFGLIVSLVFIARGGSLPELVHRYGAVDRDDAPDNIPPRVYLPILAIVLLTAAIIFWTLRR
jgi:hypothetical protein